MIDPSPLHVDTLGGEAPGRPVVLVHGFGAHNHFWRHWAPKLADERPVHMVELMGFGRAATPAEGDYSPPAQAEHLARWLRALPGHPPVLIGHSLGGAVVLLTALRLLDSEELDRLAGLVVISGAIYPQSLPPYLSMSRIRGLGELLLLAPPPHWALRMGLRGIVHDPSTLTRDLVEGYRGPLQSRARRRAILKAGRQIQPELAEKVSRRYSELSLPVLGLWGAEDPVVPPEFAERLERELPDARSVVLDGVGHLPPEEVPERSLAVVRAFLSERENPLPDQRPPHPDPRTQRDPERA
ncbi:MAG: alpha/beta hydrolase [Gemmatimonadales bacterium]|nr:MAG: alpha/beta hydrolase [Gemmatimonadales bacterium]